MVVVCLDRPRLTEGGREHQLVQVCLIYMYILCTAWMYTVSYYCYMYINEIWRKAGRSLTLRESRMYLPPWPVGPNTLRTVLLVSTPGCLRDVTSLGSLALRRNIGTASLPVCVREVSCAFSILLHEGSQYMLCTIRYYSIYSSVVLVQIFLTF